MRSVAIILCSALLVQQAEAKASVAVASAGHLVGGRAKPQYENSSGAPFRQATNGSTPTGWVQIGTPKKWLYVIFDTGSDKLVAKTWETVAAELQKVDQGISGMVIPSGLIYDHSSSSSYKRKYVIDPKTNKSEPKQSAITYGSGTAITDEGDETILVGNRNLENFTIMEITADSLQLLHTSKGIAGVLGLQHMKNQSLGHSLFSRLRNADLLTSFGYCRGTGNNGTFIWADDSKEGHEIDVIGQMHWAVKLDTVAVHHVDSGKDKDHVSGKDKSGASFIATAKKHDPKDVGAALVSEEDEVAASVLTLKNTCPNGKCTAILDTGSNIIAGPTDTMAALTKLVDVKEDCSNFDTLPTIKMTLGDYPVTVEPIGYVMKVAMPELGADEEATEEGDDALGDEDGADQTGDASGSWQGGTIGDAGTYGDDAGQGDFQEDAFASAFPRGFARDLQQDNSAQPVDVVIVEPIEPSFVRREVVIPMSLSEKKAARARARTHRKWRTVFERLYQNGGVDLRDQVDKILRQSSSNTTLDQFMCMPALVPIDKHTINGPLFIVGTPMMDTYYTRWSHPKGDGSPKVHLAPLADAKVCQDKAADESDSTPNSKLLRSEDSVGRGEFKTLSSHSRKRGPTVRSPEEITFPHWAKDLMHV